MSRLPNFFDYVKSAKEAVGKISVRDYDAYFEKLESSEPNIDLFSAVLYIIDFRTNEFLYLSPNCNDINGYTREECLKMTPLGFIQLFHPTDANIITTHFFVEGHELIKNIKNVDHSKARVSYSFRLQQKNGSCKTLMQQFTSLLVDGDHNPLVIMGATIDISEIHSKPEMFCRIHYQSPKGKWEKIYERIYSLTEKQEEYDLTPKEIEIIKFVHKGLSSKEIARKR